MSIVWEIVSCPQQILALKKIKIESFSVVSAPSKFQKLTMAENVEKGYKPLINEENYLSDSFIKFVR